VRKEVETETSVSSTSGVGEIICGRGSDAKVMAEERKMKELGWL
jgi:hypothetical protein